VGYFDITSRDLSAGDQIWYQIIHTFGSETPTAVRLDSNGMATIAIPTSEEFGQFDVAFTFWNESLYPYSVEDSYLAQTSIGNTLVNATISVSEADTPAITISAQNTVIDEGDEAVFVVDTNGAQPNGSILWGWNGTVTPGQDIDPMFPGYWNPSTNPQDDIGPNNGFATQSQTNSSGVATIRIPTLIDDVDEPTETITVYLSSGESASVSIRNVEPLPPTYRVLATQSTINEGQMASFVVQTTNVEPNTQLNYTLSGVSRSDISQPLTGSVTIGYDGTGTVRVGTIVDSINESSETMVLRLDNGESASIRVVDRAPSYSVRASDSVINEGESARFIISTENVAPNTYLNYSLSGVSNADISGYLSDYRSVRVDSNGQATVGINTLVDSVNEVSELLTLTLQSGQSSSVEVRDLVPTINISSLSSNILEGQLASFTIETENMNPNSYIDYSLQGISSSDVVGPLIGSVRTDSSGVARLFVETVDDSISEGTEVLTLLLGTGESSSVSITDASTGYRVTADRSVVFEGDTVNFTIEKTGTIGSNLISYVLQGEQLSLDDVLGGSLSGSVQLDSQGRGYVPVTIAQDQLAEPNEQFSLVLENGIAAVVTVRDFVQTQSIESVSYENGSHLSEGFGNGVVVNYTSNDTTIRSLTFDLLADGATEPEASLTVTTDAFGNASGILRLTSDTFPEPDQTYLIQLSGNPQVSRYVQFRDDDSGNAISGGSGSEVLTTSDDDDVVDAGIGDDFVIASGGNDFIDGGAGQDAVEYQGSTSSEISLRKDGDAVVVGLSGKSDRLLDVERLHFEDQWVALDMNGNAGNAAKIIVAAFGSELLDDYLGIGIGVADDGLSMAGLANLVVNTGLMPYSTSGQFVDLVFNNLLDRDANALEKNLYSGYLDDGLYTEADLLVMAANTQMSNAYMLDFAIDNVGLPYLDTLV